MASSSGQIVAKPGWTGRGAATVTAALPPAERDNIHTTASQGQGQGQGHLRVALLRVLRPGQYIVYILILHSHTTRTRAAKAR